MSLPLLRAPRSLRGRLTLWHALILGVVLVLFTAVVYGILARSLSDQVDRSLVERAGQLGSVAMREGFGSPRGRHGEPGGRLGHGGPEGEFRFPPPARVSSAGVFAQLSLPNGEVVAAENLGGRRLPIDQVALRTDEPRFRVVELDGQRVRVYSTRLEVGGEVAGVVQVGRSVRDIEDALRRVRRVAGAVLAAALLLSGLVVSAMADRTLRPLERLIRTAQGIGSSRDLSRRVEISPNAEDEVGRLATTFNGMLARLQESDAQLRETLEGQRRFVADASHELRTPLTTIRGNAGMLRQVGEMAPEDRAEAMEEIFREAERMSRLVADLLALARADAGRTLERAPVDLAAVVREMAAQAARLAHDRRIEVEAPNTFAVTGDSDALRQLALILLDNAVKYTRPDGRIAVWLEDRGGEARLSISDDGEGVAPEHLPHLFERFYRADPARSEGGAGLGLSIAAWIAERHGGRITVESALSRGSTFSVSLPRPSAESAVAPAEKSSGGVVGAPVRSS